MSLLVEDPPLSARASEQLKRSEVFDKGSRRRWIMGLCLLCTIASAVTAWVFRFSVNPDGISYLDIASQLRAGNLRELVHPYWSPAFPCGLALAFSLFSPSPHSELIVAHGLNFLAALLSLAGFTFFLHEWLQVRPGWNRPDGSLAAFRVRTAFAYALFLWSTIEMIGFADLTPDFLVAAIVYLAAGLSCRMARVQNGNATAAILGLTLGLGYYAKAVLLLLGVALLFCLAAPTLSNVQRKRRLIVSAVTFVMVVSPYILILSHRQGHLTFSEAGRLNYAWLVTKNIPRVAGWVGHTPGAGEPVHGPRLLNEGPTVLEFANTVPGTYPLWYDPAFFHDGLRVRFDASRQIAALQEAWTVLVALQGSILPQLLAGLAALLVLGIRRQSKFDFSGSWLAAWSIIALLVFALVASMLSRYIGPFVVLFWIAAYDTFPLGAGPLGSGNTNRIRRAVIGVVAAAMLLPQLLGVASATDLAFTRAPENQNFVIASDLTHLGLRPGDRIATVGYPFSVYYARLGGLRVVANIGFRGERDPYDSDRLWTLDDHQFDRFKNKLLAVGVKAIVSPQNCDLASQKGWRILENTSYCAKLLDQPRQDAVVTNSRNPHLASPQ